ncbi:MAG: uncharacterized protein QOG22_1914 [Pseudonocardiales bacterium]|nr:uncharacterized protein [Pseudonocardiales bacterium]
MVSVVEPLSAPLELSFAYTRSLGPTLGPFMTALAERRILVVRGSDGRVHVPPAEYDPVTAEPLTEFVEVADEGVVVSWTWLPAPLEGQPLQHPFGWALIRLDGADTCLLHAVDVTVPEDLCTGMRVQARWAPERTGHIRDIVCFEPADTPRAPVEPAAAVPPVEIVTTRVDLHFEHTASAQESSYLLGLQDGRLLAQRCPQCRKVYLPPRGACPSCGVPTEEEVELPDRGTVTTFCIVNVAFLGQHITPPYVGAYVLLDGADIAFLHLILGCAADEVRMGMRVEAVWRPRAEWGPALQNIDHFRPTGEPDAPYDTYAEHL